MHTQSTDTTRYTVVSTPVNTVQWHVAMHHTCCTCLPTISSGATCSLGFVTIMNSLVDASCVHAGMQRKLCM